MLGLYTIDFDLTDVPKETHQVSKNMKEEDLNKKMEKVSFIICYILFNIYCLL